MRVCADYRELREKAVLVFEFNIELVGPQERLGFAENCAEGTWQKPMVHIVCHPSLKRASRRRTHRAAAVDKATVGAANLSNVSANRNEAAVRQHKTQSVLRGCEQVAFEFGYFHDFILRTRQR